MKGFVESEKIRERANGLKKQSQEFVDTMNNNLYKNSISRWNEHPVSASSIETSIMLYKIERIYYDDRQSINGKLVNIYNALSCQESNILIVIAGDRKGVEFYIGVGNVKKDDPLPAMILEKNLKGCFPGIKTSKVDNIGNTGFKSQNKDSITVVSGIPKARESEEEFVQGIEKLIEAMNGEDYMALLIAEPISKDRLLNEKRYYENLFSGLSESTEWVLNYSEENGSSHMESTSSEKGKTTGTNASDTKGTGNSTENSKTDVSSSGTSQGDEKLINIWNKINNTSTGTNLTQGESISSSENHTEGTSETLSESSGSSTSETLSKGSNGSIQVTQQNKMILNLMDRINLQIDRINSAESMGAWDCAAYFISEGITSEVAATIYKSLIVGETAYPDEYLIHTWKKRVIGDNNFKIIEADLLKGIHPTFVLDNATINPATLINGAEMPLLGGIPQKSVNGVAVIEGAEFGRNISKTDCSERIEVGSLYHMGETYKDNRVSLDINTLASHCFITGSTGSGKSNTTYKLLSELNKNDVKFMVIEPAKGEYKLEFGNLEGINIFTTNPRFYSMLAINPFEFNDEIHVLEHIERLLEIFSACWPLYAAMPAVLKETFERAYVEHGWDLQKSFYFNLGNGKYPTFNDVLKYLPVVIQESRFSGETRDNYIGALYTRLKSLTTGIIGKIFNGGGVISDSNLFDENTIIDLSRVGSSETKALLMGILVLKLSEYRMASRKRNAPLKHVTVIEEAHNLLKRTSPNSHGQESADVQGKAVEMISGFIAETRTYGEGFIIVDQSPTAVDVSAIKNTNTKIAMRLPEAYDAEAVGHAMGLSEAQIIELSKLEQGVAAIYQSGWNEPVLVKVDKSDDKYNRESFIENDPEERKRINGELIREIIRQFTEKNNNPVIIEKVLEKGTKSQSIRDVLYWKYKEYGNESALGNKNAALLKCIVSILECSDMLKVYERLLPDKTIKNKDQVDVNVMNQAIEWKNSILKILPNYAYFNSEEDKKNLLSIIMKYGIEFSPRSSQYKTLQYCLKEEQNWRKRN